MTEPQTFKNDCLEFENASQALTYFVNKIVNKENVESLNPKNKDTYKKEIIELHPVFFKITNPKKVIFHHPSFSCLPYWVVSEILTEMLGVNPPIMNNYREDIVSWSYDLLCSGRACYQYGVRWLNFNTIEKTYERLKNNSTSKRCYVPIFDPHDVGDKNDSPCNLGFLFLIRNNKLDLTLFCRSIDIMRGFRYDLALFSFIQQLMAKWLNVEIGDFYYFCNSLHSYSQDANKLRKLKFYLVYHENDILELNLGGEDLEIRKTYDDLRKLLEIEILSRNGLIENANELIKKLNYKIFRDFGKVYLLKNNTSTVLANDNIVNSMETSIANWYK